MMKAVKRSLHLITVALFALIATIAAIHFPYDVDAPLTPQEIEAAQKYYTDAYKKPPESQGSSEYETKYIQVSEAAARSERIEEQVSAFVQNFNLSDRPVLEIGSGRGYLQDIAQNYTGLDISPSVARFYHKRFVLGSATAMPFPDNSFDGI
jgi:cyclopropane fatty-acyl-phospholipid synthase-like methyltransferase